MARSLASSGYVAATIDHARDAIVVKFPKKDKFQAANLSKYGISLEKAVNVRRDSTLNLALTLI